MASTRATRSIVARFTVTPEIVDVDDTGEIVGRLPPEQTPAWEFVGRHGLEPNLKAKLAELDAFLVARGEWLNAQPNRAQRRARKGRG